MSTLNAGVFNISKFLTLPKYTTTERDALSNVVAGTILYNTTTKTVQYYNGSQSAWLDIITV